MNKTYSSNLDLRWGNKGPIGTVARTRRIRRLAFFLGSIFYQPEQRLKFIQSLRYIFTVLYQLSRKTHQFSEPRSVFLVR